MELIFIIIFFIIFLMLLFIIYFIGVKLNNDIKDTIENNNKQTSCYYRRWGCCGDKLTPKLDPQGSNCRGF